MNINNTQHLVYLNLQLPVRELDWLLAALMALLADDERLWVSQESEYGSKAQLHSSFEKVVGRARTVSMRLLCSAPRSRQILEGLMAKDKPMGIQWQIQPLMQTGEF